jgi:nitrate reductase delta subunit
MRLLEALARVLTYPGKDYRERVAAAVDCAADSTAVLLCDFAREIAGLDELQLQELYTVTFDLNPTCALEVGWHLFGENYDRGMLMAKIRELMRLHGVVETAELPDHLVHVLPLLARMDQASAADFAGAVVLPALAKMVAAFKDNSNPYQHVMRAAEHAVRALCPGAPDFTAAKPEPLLKILE